LVELKLAVVHNGVTYYGIKVGMSAGEDGNREFESDIPKIWYVARLSHSCSAHCVWP
jgi:hypothetical protein